jgi:nitrite reductase/ring-hydroxylating ferredoxin subunit
MRLLVKIFPLVLLSLIALSPESCKKSATTCNGVPNVGVSFQLDISLPSNSKLTTVNGYEVVTGGNNGIIVYRYTSSVFNAYDCVCPYEGTSNSKALVQPQSGGIYAKCPVCGSTFLLSDGSVSKGPATCPLKKYNTTFDGTSIVTVSN